MSVFKFVLVIELVAGVRTRVVVELDYKVAGHDALRVSGELVAEKLGGRFSHYEDAR